MRVRANATDFGLDPNKCPYVLRRAWRVQGWHGYKIGDSVEYLDPATALHSAHYPWVRGEIAAIGTHAEDYSGQSLVIFAIKGEDATVRCKTHRDVIPIVE